MKLLMLSHLLLSGEMSVGELAIVLDISNTYVSLVSDGLVADGFALKVRKGKRVIVRANMESPFVQSYLGFAVIVGGYPPYTPVDFLEPESRRKILWQLKNGGKSISELAKITGYSRPAIYSSLKPFLGSDILLVGKGKTKKYCVNVASPLLKRLFEVLDFFESDIDLRPLLEKISSDQRAVALSIFGSQAAGTKDRLSDVDVLVIVGSTKDRDIANEYKHSKLQLNVYSRRGIIQLVRAEPWFLKLVLEGRILKGGNLLDDLMSVPSNPDYSRVISEVRDMLASMDRLPEREKARIMMYCIRTAISMKLFLEGGLSQKRLMDTLAKRYPEFNAYRANKNIDPQTFERSKKNVMEDMLHVEERKEEER